MQYRFIRLLRRFFRLYSETYYGTKDLIECRSLNSQHKEHDFHSVLAFYDEQIKALQFVRDCDELSLDEKRHFFKSANTNLGTSALCLSGGASFGYCQYCKYPSYPKLIEGLSDHFGVVKAFVDAGLLPRVITGTSAGGIIAALACTRTDSELRQLLIPELATRISAADEPFAVWGRRFWKTGARFDSVAWARKVLPSLPLDVSHC